MKAKRKAAKFVPRRYVGLNLGGHCIQTAAVREIRRVEYLMQTTAKDDPAMPALAERHSILRRFLEKTDFESLRASRPELDGRAEMKVRIRLLDGGDITLEDVIPEQFPPDEDEA